MAKRYGIARAIDAARRPVARAAIDVEPQPFRRPLTCAGPECAAGVTAVRGHWQKATWVEPLFRLGAGAEHAEGCPYDIDTQMKALVREHRAAVKKTDGIYRLQLDGGERPTAIEQLMRQPDRPGKPRRPAGIRSDSSRTISPVLAAARDMARLVMNSGQDPEVRAAFGVLYGSELLTWDEFCWPAHRIAELVTDLTAHPTRPRAVYGPVEEFGLTTGEKPTAFITMSTVPANSKVLLRLRSADLPLAKWHGRARAIVLGFGTKWGGLPSTSNPKEIRMWVADRTEIASWRPT